MSDMNVALVISFLTKGTAKVRKDLDGLRRSAGEFKRGLGDALVAGFSEKNLDAAIGRAETRLNKARSRLMGAVGMGMTLFAPIRAAAAFEETFADLEKVLDAPKAKLDALRKALLDMSGEIALSATGLTTIMAEAAAAGIPVDELKRFTAFTAKAAVAFDMAAGDIGERFAKLRNVYMLNQEGLERFADAANHLSNNLAAKASEITDFANRAAGAGNILKLNAVEMEALGAAMVSAGIAPEIAARGVGGLANRLVKGTDKVREALASVGISHAELLKDLEVDAPAALVNLFETLSKSPEGMRALIDIVGADFSDDFSKLLKNPDLLAKAFALVSDEAAFAESAVIEYEKRASKTMGRWELFKNLLASITITLGTVLLPAVNDMMESVGGMARRFSEFAEANPELTATIVKAAAALLLFGIAGRLAAFAIALIRLPVLHLVNALWRFNAAGKNVSIVARSFRGIGRAAAWLGRLLRGGAVLGAFTALRAVGTAALGAIAAAGWPVLLVVGLIAGAVFALWKWWDRITSLVGGFAEGLYDAFAPDIEALKRAWDGLYANMRGWVGRIAEGLGVDAEAAMAAFDAAFDFSGIGETLGRVKDQVLDFFRNLFSRETLSDTEKADLKAAGKRVGENFGNAIREAFASFSEFGRLIVDNILAGLDAAWAELVAWFQSRIDQLKELLKFNVDINWPEPPEWLKWLADKVGLGEGEVPSPAATVPAIPPMPAPGELSMDGYRTRSMFDMESDAGRAGEKLGATAAGALENNAAEIGRMVGAAAAAQINRARVTITAKGLAEPVERAKVGALHDGVE